MTDLMGELFEQELSRRGLSFDRMDEGLYRLRIDSVDVTVNLENTRRDAERETGPAAIVRFVDRVLASVRFSMPEWEEAARYLLFSAEAAGHDFENVLHTELTDEVVGVVTLTNASQSMVTWVTEDMCRSWGVSPEEVEARALVNQDRLLDGVELDIHYVDGDKLGSVPVGEPYKASVIFSERFRSLVEPELGWPVLVVIPCRDFIYVLADGSPLLSRIGSVVVEEFKTSGYPITTEVLHVSDDGIQAVGQFPVQSS